MAGNSEWDASLDAFIEEDERREVEAVLRSIGFEGEVTPGIHFFSMGEVPWVLMFSVPITAFLTSFFGAAGADAWKAFKRFAIRVQEARRPRRGSIQFVPRDSPSITIPEGLPDEAYEALFELDLSAFDDSVFIVWDADEHRWRDAAS